MASRMSLQNLPVEIFNHIIESLVASVGIFKAVRLRSVNTRFNSAIWFAICTRQVIDIKDPAIPGLYLYMPTSLKGRILLSKSYSQEAIKEDKALFVIASTNQALDSLTQPNEQRRFEQHRMISEAVAAIGSYEISWLDRNGQEVSTEEVQTHNLISGAIVIGNLPLVQSLMGKISVNANVNRENPYFGRPLHTAAAWGRIEIVQYLLDHGADLNRFTGAQGEDNDDDWEHARLHSRHEY
ncbi:hypothetical protein SI65_09413 [Aspergillus cristatus]|uniref:Uncharacterized protein n=1 Tax=Aspergillus cristatus TaxID=573508 RepID=A0A1E3B2M8_ASPCR|nr:hypothetical protein SI65_09413 [Aspergillus cristatus]